MSEASLRTAMIRMATDEEFAARVAADPQSVATELGLTDAELATLQSLRVSDEEGGPERMQGRISRSGLFTGGALGALLDLGHIVGPDHAGFVCNEHDGIVGPDHPAGLLCDGFHPQIHGLLCDGFQPGGTDHPAGLLCNGFHPHTHSLLCNGKADGFVCDGHAAPAGLLCDGKAHGFVCDGKPADGLVCNGTPAGFICDGAHTHGLVCDGHAAPAGLLCDGKAHGFVCNGKPVDGFVCDEKPADGFLCDGKAAGFVCNGKPAGFICDGAHSHTPVVDAKPSAGFFCDGATPAAHLPHADVPALDKISPNSLLKPGANLDLGPAVG